VNKGNSSRRAPKETATAGQIRERIGLSFRGLNEVNPSIVSGGGQRSLLAAAGGMLSSIVCFSLPFYCQDAIEMVLPSI